ncbi:MAG TPA: homoserine kinase [Dehalococcoidia bacterium]|nr:homoserine kinase [Dehalococcoidia bacterium]
MAGERGEAGEGHGRSITVRVPATSANLGPGFDAMGIALDLTGEVTVTLHSRPAPFPRDKAEQIALAAARAVFQHARRPPPVALQATYAGDIPVGRGLGASAVLRAGAVVAANGLLGEPFTLEELAVLAAELEGHADNVVPALFGGFQVVVWDEGALTRVQVPLPPELEAVLLIPDLEMPTSETRKHLPLEVSRQEAVHNIGRATLLVACMATGRLDGLRVATQDVLHQPARSRIFPALYDVIDAALGAGAWGAYLSGGGSAVLAFTTGRCDAVGAAMVAAAAQHGTAGHYLCTRPRLCGAEIVRDEATE